MSDTNIKQNDDVVIDDLELGHDFSTEKNESSDNNTISDEKKVEHGEVSDDTVVISKSKLIIIKKILASIKVSNDQLSSLLLDTISAEDEQRISVSQIGDSGFNLNGENKESGDGRIIEGVFDGESMIGPDGKQYSVPANYASKSKLIEGDTLKLTITRKGTFVYKQIKPIDRRRVIGMLSQEGNGNYIVSAENSKWHVLTASVTYYKGQAGDEIVIIVPENGQSKWGAVDNIMKNAN